MKWTKVIVFLCVYTGFSCCFGRSVSSISRDICFFDGSVSGLSDLYYELAVKYVENKELINALGVIDTASRVCGVHYIDERFDIVKLDIADRMSNGEKCRLFGLSILPRISSQFKKAIEISSALIESSSNYDLVASSMLVRSKAFIGMSEWYLAIEALNDVIDEFSNTKEAIEAKICLIDVCGSLLKKCSLDYEIFDLGARSFDDVQSSPLSNDDMLTRAISVRDRMYTIFESGLRNVASMYASSNNIVASDICLRSIKTVNTV